MANTTVQKTGGKSTLNPATDAHINSKMKDLEAKLSGG